MTDAPHARPIHSQGLLLIAVAVGVLGLAVYLTANIIEDESGGISAAIRVIGACLAIVSLVRPKAGLYIITVEGFSVDFLKKVAVYYGATSMNTIIEVLIVTMLAVVGTILGIFLQSVALRRYKLAPLNWGLLIGSSLLAVAILFATKSANGFAKAAEDSFNCAVYIALAVPMTICLATRDDLNRLLKVQFWFVVVWALWGIKQYYMGFNRLEWFYAETGLSQVASEHMLLFAEPRPFGFGSGAANYGVISPYFVYGVWCVFQARRNRLLYLLGTLVVFWGLVTSLQRSALLFPLFVPVFYYCFKTAKRTVIVYAAAIGIFLLGVYFAEYLLEHLYDIDAAVAMQGSWGESVLHVGTYSARLASWTQLKNAHTYSWFGSNEQEYTHDVFTKILFSYGVIGLLLVVAAGGAAVWFLHRTLLRIEDPADRNFATFLLATTTPYIGLGFIGGGNFTTNPTNLQMWTFFGAAVSLAVNSKLVPLAAQPVVGTLRDLLLRHTTERNPSLKPSSGSGLAPGLPSR